MSVTMIQAAIVLAATFMLAMVLVIAIGPIVEQLDIQRSGVDTHSFTVANQTMGNIKAWFYGVIVASCAITTIWFFLVVIAKARYRRQEQAMYQQYRW
jgi:hypothetical protein